MRENSQVSSMVFVSIGVVSGIIAVVDLHSLIDDSRKQSINKLIQKNYH
jgi:hypothetical protein